MTLEELATHLREAFPLVAVHAAEPQIAQDFAMKLATELFLPVLRLSEAIFSSAEAAVRSEAAAIEFLEHRAGELAAVGDRLMGQPAIVPYWLEALRRQAADRVGGDAEFGQEIIAGGATAQAADLARIVRGAFSSAAATSRRTCECRKYSPGSRGSRGRRARHANARSTMNSASSESLPPVVKTAAEIRKLVEAARREGKKTGLVPTMGALHEGHLSLVRRAAADCEAVFVTIFVNPTQFGPSEDLAKYPRDLERDLALLAPLGVTAVFAPSEEEVYPPGATTAVEPPAVAATLEGACRPVHFGGVATVCLKLFHLLPADVAYFGQKDYQQTLVVRHMVRDLLVPIEIRVCPTVREPDGLAMSSRNAYLDAADRNRALSLSRALARAAELVEESEKDAAVLRNEMQQVLIEAGVDQIDYATLADPETLEEVSTIDRTVMALVAAHVGGTRLIDNRRIG